MIGNLIPPRNLNAKTIHKFNQAMLKKNLNEIFG